VGLSKEQYLLVHQRFFDLKMAPGREFCEILDYAAYVDEDRRFHGSWLRVSSECETGVNELLNWINHFAKTISDVEVWTQVLDEHDDEETRLSINFEIVAPIAFMTLSFPAAIHGKLVFILARALRDLFKIKRPNGKSFDDRDLNLGTLRQISKQVTNHAVNNSLETFLKELTGINGEDFRSATLNYRNRANHQIAPGIEFGERFTFTPLIGDGFEGLEIGVEYPIRLRDLIGSLKHQHEVCCRTYKTFWDVVVKLNNSMRVETE
jgi:hypothetical protein